MHGYARRNSVEGLARDTACRAAGQIGESGPPRSTDVRKGSRYGTIRGDPLVPRGHTRSARRFRPETWVAGCRHARTDFARRPGLDDGAVLRYLPVVCHGGPRSACSPPDGHHSITASASTFAFRHHRSGWCISHSWEQSRQCIAEKEVVVTAFLSVLLGAVMALAVREIITRWYRSRHPKPPKPPPPVTRYTKDP
jgi:hypothetical protein